MFGTANVSGGIESYNATYSYSKSSDSLTDTIDIFGWRGSTGTVKWGIGTSTSNTDYSDDFVD